MSLEELFREILNSRLTELHVDLACDTRLRLCKLFNNHIDHVSPDHTDILVGDHACQALTPCSLDLVVSTLDEVDEHLGELHVKVGHVEQVARAGYCVYELKVATPVAGDGE